MELKENRLLACTSSENVQKLLLEYLENNNAVGLEKLLSNEDKIDINYIYDDPYYKTALQIAICDYAETTHPKCVEILLTNGADPLIENEHGKDSIITAAEGGRQDLLQLILDYLKKQEKNYDFPNCMAILSTIQHIKDSDEDDQEGRYVKVIQTLLDYNININLADPDSGQTAIYRAALYSFKEIVKTILDTKNDIVNLDKHVDRKGNTARTYIVTKKLYEGELPENNDENDNNTTEMLYKNLREKNSDEFNRNYEIFKENTKGNEHKNTKYHLLQQAVRNGLDKCVEILINDNIDINSTLFNEHLSLIEEAASNGYYKIVKILLDKNCLPLSINRALLELMKAQQKTDNNDSRNYNECLDKLLKQKHLKINYEDELNKNTALHYAAKYQSPETCLKLLRKGASLACNDLFSFLPIADMEPDTIKKHLDECIVLSDKQCKNDDVDRHITINVTSLLTPRTNTYLTDFHEENLKINIDSQPLTDELMTESTIKTGLLLQETSVLEYMSKQPDLKHLLKHPVIMIFLYLKWYNIRQFFYINLAVYLSFFISLLLYVMFGFNHISQSNHSIIIVNISYYVLFITFLMLLIREIGQMIIYKIRYFYSFENWLELTLLLIVLIVLLNQISTITIRQISAVAIVLSAIELLLLVGQFPSLATNIMMLRTVSYTFFKLLLWYSILLLAFAFSFYTLFQNEGDKNEKTNKTEDDDEEQDFFEDPGMSLLKTIVMLTGEFDAGSIKFNSYPIISHLIFVSFVFLITIVLFNLLNGLAVSDTQIIKSDAELYDQILRVEHIAHMEKVLLKNGLLHLIPAVQQICLFPQNKVEARIEIYTNQDYNVIYEEQNDSVSPQCNNCRSTNLNKKLQKVLQNHIMEMEEDVNRKYKENEVLNQLKALKDQLNALQNILLASKK